MVKENQDSLNEILESITCRGKITTDFYCDFQDWSIMDDNVNGTSILNYCSKVILIYSRVSLLK